MDGQGTEQAALGQAIRRLREVRRLSIRDLAHEAAMSSGHLSVIERGHGNPRLSTLFAIAEALDTTLSQLVRGGGAGLTPIELQLGRRSDGDGRGQRAIRW
jgi:transcriptional regulator with XRE-family HTH domain